MGHEDFSKMNRRRFLVGLGGLTSVGSAVVGTAAFTSTAAERSVVVDTADDDRAFLRLEPLVDSGLDGDPTLRSIDPGSTVRFQLPGSGTGENPNAEGLGVDSVYEFHNLLEIVNQGTQPVELYSTYDGDALSDLALVRDSGVLRNEPPVLNVGEHIDVGLAIDTHGSSIGTFDETLTIVADQPNN